MDRKVIAENLITGEILNFNNMSQTARYFKCARGTIFNNRIKNWNFKICEPKIPIKELINK